MQNANTSYVYRKVEAMYYKNYSSSEIARACDITIMRVLDIMQQIFAKNQG